MKSLNFKSLTKWVLLASLLVIALAPGVLAKDRLILATTTSTQDTGLLDVLLPVFEAKYDVQVDVIAVGTGKAIAIGENGDADVILVHARASEDKFVAEGYGVNRKDVMYNDYVLAGPKSDPANVKNAKNAADALGRIANKKATFVSRGDDSGTHKKELELWKVAGINPKGSWYLAAGQGMSACLTMADEKNAYIIADRGTWLARKDTMELQVLFEGDPVMFNPYGIIAVNPLLHSHVNYKQAMNLVNWIVSAEAQKIIKEFTIGGEPLFRLY